MKRALILALTGTMLPFAAPAYPKASVSGLLCADYSPRGAIPRDAVARINCFAVGCSHGHHERDPSLTVSRRLPHGSHMPRIRI